MSIFRGSGVALVTPMKENGEVNYDSLEALLEDQIKNHTDAVISVGTSGEAPTLEDDEHLEVIKFTVDVVRGRIPVIAGTGSNNTAHAIMMSEEAEKLGADGLLLVTPYYNKATQDGLVDHYTAIASRTKLPCIVYNVPSRTGTTVQPETMIRIAKKNPNVCAIKEASGNFSAIAHLADLADGKIDIYSGNDDQVVPLCSLGGVGVISVLANVAPQATHDMVAVAFFQQQPSTHSNHKCSTQCPSTSHGVKHLCHCHGRESNLPEIGHLVAHRLRIESAASRILHPRVCD